MPTPNPENETRDEWMDRCVPKVIEDGTADSPEQAAAICSSMWDDAVKDEGAGMNRAYSIIEIKAADDDQRIIEGVASTPTPDRAGDVVEPMGAKFALPMPLLWQHDSIQPVGEVVTAKPTKNGIPFRARIAQTDEPGRLKDRLDEVWQSIKLRLVRGVSIGFRAIEMNAMRDGGLRFVEWEWLELSLVTIPANAEATISRIKSIDALQRAATGQARQASSKAPGASGSSKTEAKGIPKMKPIPEQITDLRERCAEHAEALKALLEKEDAEGRLDDSDREQRETIERDAKADAAKLRSLENVAEVMKAAKPVEINPERISAPARAAPVRVEVKATPKEEYGLDFARSVWCLAKANFDPWRALDIQKAFYPGHNRLSAYLKAQVPGAATTDPTWLGPLAEPQLLAGEFVEFLRASTIIGKFGTGGIPSLRRVPFNVKVPVQTTGGAGYWVGEGRAKPLTQFDVTTTTLPFYKVANIAVVSEEMLRHATVSAETFIRNALRDALQARLDADFIDPAITLTAGIRPASITNGATTSASTAVTAAEVMADLKTLMQTFITAGISLTSMVWIMRESAALALSTMVTTLGQREFPDISVTGGTLLQIPVITSQHVPSGIVALVSADNIYLSDDGGISIALSREASLEMDTAPASMINNDASPAVSVEATMVSMFQTNSVAIRAERAIAWLRRRSAAVAYLTSVGWGNTGSSPDGAPI